MSTVREILAEKGNYVLSVGPDASVLDAAILMNEHKTGSVMVLEAGQVAGMFTERDVLRRVVGEQRDPAKTRVADVMTTGVLCCRPETTLDEARGAMKTHRIRHLPVVDEAGHLHGVISIGDLNGHMVKDQEQTIYLMQEYLYGRT